MTRFNRALWLSAAASVVFAMGCGGGGDTDAGTGGCTTDATCGSGKACHPVLKTCVSSCTGSSDCPSSEKTCAKINNSAASFCTCSTDALCAAATTGNICNGATRACTAKCTANSCPSGFTCDTASGNCTGGGSDAGTDAGVTTDGGVACNSSNFEPDVCGYANVCYSDNKCDIASNDLTCANIAAAINANNYTAWNPATSNGPVIYNVTDDADVAAGCTGGTDVAFTTTVYAYAGGTYVFPATIGAATQLTYYTSTGAVRPVNNVLVGSGSNAWSGYTVANGGKNVTIKMTLCAQAGTSSLTAGFAFSGGNAFCASLTH